MSKLQTVQIHLTQVEKQLFFRSTHLAQIPNLESPSVQERKDICEHMENFALAWTFVGLVWRSVTRRDVDGQDTIMIVTMATAAISGV